MKLRLVLFIFFILFLFTGKSEKWDNCQSSSKKPFMSYTHNIAEYSG
jgi:hypothetical protein